MVYIQPTSFPLSTSCSSRNKTMMIISRDTLHSNPTVQVPPWDSSPIDDPTALIHSPFFVTSPNGAGTNAAFFDDLTALRRYLPSNVELDENDDVADDFDDVPVDAFSCDHFRMYEFKVRRCARGRSHDWTECPYAHPGEKARRRDPRKFHYSGNPCPEFRKSACQKGDACEYAHGVFECWLHPSRYRTQPCKDGVHCRRKICFFAHVPDQLRLLPASHNGSPQSTLPDSYDGSPSRVAMGKGSFGSSPPSSPPMSPVLSLGPNSLSELALLTRNLQFGKPTRLSTSPMSGSGFCSARSVSNFGPGFSSLPSTPTRIKAFDYWDQGCGTEEPLMERVESGKELRAKIYAKLGRENSFADRVDSTGSGSCFGRVY